MLNSADIVHKTRDDYNRVAGHFSDTRYDNWRELKQFQPLVESGQKILDWGCGNGRLLLMLAKKNIKYFGVDQSAELLKIARHKHRPLIKDGTASFFCTASRPKNFPNDFFDLVFMVASFHHLPDKNWWLKILKKIRAEMKTGAKLIITVWNLQSDWAQAKAAKGWKKMGENDFLIPWKNNRGETQVERFYHHFSKQELSDLLAVAGFKILKIGFDAANFTPDKKSARNLIAVATK